MDFPCTGCGGCCRVVGEILAHPEHQIYPIMRQAVKDFPFDFDEHGVCSKLKDNKCSVYHTRPLLCDIKALGEAMGMDLSSWYRLNAASCNFLIDKLNLDPSYKINKV